MIWVPAVRRSNFRKFWNQARKAKACPNCTRPKTDAKTSASPNRSGTQRARGAEHTSPGQPAHLAPGCVPANRFPIPAQAWTRILGRHQPACSLRLRQAAVLLAATLRQADGRQLTHH